MNWQITHFTWIHLVTALVSLQLVFTVYRMSSIRGRIPFLWMMALSALWSFILSFESAVPTIEDKIIFSRLEYICNMFIPLFFVDFILSYDLERPGWVKRHLWVFWIVPVLTLALVFSSSYHTLIWTGFSWSSAGSNILVYHHGPAFFIAMAYSLLMIVFGIGLMVSFIRRRPRYYREKAVYLILAASFPLITAALYTLGLSPVKGLDISPMGIIIAGGIFFWAISREQLFDLVPTGRQLMVETMSDGVIMLDSRDFIMDINPAAYNHFGVQETLKGRRLDLVLPELAGLGSSVSAGSELHLELFINPPVNRWFEVVRNPMHDERRNLLGYLLIIHDITHRKEAQEQLRTLNEDLTEMNAMKDRLYSIIGHDLRSPFNSILGFAELLATAYDDFTDEERRTFADNILTAARNTFNLLENLLEWSRIQMGRISFSPEEQNLNLAVNEVFRLLRLNADEKMIQLSAAVPFAQTVYADHNMLYTILRNLVSNGIKFSHPGGSVMVSSRAREGRVEIRVTDKGIGMTDTTLKKLFRIDSLHSLPGTANEKGTGLGLVLCKEFAEKNGGSIRAESLPGEGTTFILNLPGIAAV